MSKLQKVTFQWDDGAVESLSGDDADRWFQECNSCAFLAGNHGEGMPEFEWTIETPSPSSKLGEVMDELKRDGDEARAEREMRDS